LAEPSQIERSALGLKYLPARHILQGLAWALRDDFSRAQPFGHCVIDDFFPEAILDSVLEELPQPESEKWTRWASDPESARSSSSKWGISDVYGIGEVTSSLMLRLISAPFLDFLEILSGLSGLIGDPRFRGGGVHSTGRGGCLPVHSDAERHPMGRPFCQALNLIIFLNRQWSPSFGGDLELWSRDGGHPVVKIPPLFNRMVIFESGTNTFHGHPHPLTCGSNRRRISLAAYYYLIDRSRDANYSNYNTLVQWLR